MPDDGLYAICRGDDWCFRDDPDDLGPVLRVGEAEIVLTPEQAEAVRTEFALTSEAARDLRERRRLLDNQPAAA